MGKLFGTDGVRGVANTELTPSLAFRLGQAGAYVLSKEHAHPRIIIGKDTRVSGDMLEAALIAGICSVGADVLRVGVLPTPGIAYLTRTMDVSAGVVISASHNPVQDKPWQVPVGSEVGRIIEVADAQRRYIDFLKSSVGRLDGLRIVLDCANGASSRVGPQVLSELGAEVIPLFNEPNGININLGCGSTYPERLREAVLEYGADVGLANDGDADRLIAVDEQGQIVDGDFIMVICALELKNKGKLEGNAVVVTVMSNMGLYLALKEAGIRIYATQVGDRYVMEELLRTGAKLGGEQSGHIIFLDHNTTGDGLLTGIQLLSVVKERGVALSTLASQMQRLPQVLLNIRVTNKDKIMEDPEVVAKIREIEEILGDRGRILVRPSGTEPLIRVMVEGTQEFNLDELAKSVIALIHYKEESWLGA